MNSPLSEQDPYTAKGVHLREILLYMRTLIKINFNFESENSFE
jgi:hypothetical protein